MHVSFSRTWSAVVPDVPPRAVEQIINVLEEEISKQGLDQEVKVIKTGCFGLCALGPIMIVYPERQLLLPWSNPTISRKLCPSIC